MFLCVLFKLKVIFRHYQGKIYGHVIICDSNSNEAQKKLGVSFKIVTMPKLG